MLTALPVFRVFALTAALLQPKEEELPFRWELASAIVAVTDDVHEQNLLAKIARFESSYVERIARCDCKKHECDKGRSYSSWQLLDKPQACESTESAARIALEMVRESVKLCHFLPANERLSLYARGTCLSDRGRQLSKIRWIP